MTDGKKAVKELMKKKLELQKVLDEMTDLENVLRDMEINNKGNIATIEHVDGDKQFVDIYLEEGNYIVGLNFWELLEII